MDMREVADDLLAATEARRVELGKRWKQVYQEAGLTHQTLNRWRHGHPVDPLTERSLERALLWAPGAREAIAAHQKPRTLSDAEAAAQEPRTQPAPPEARESTPPLPPPIAPTEALRRMVRSSARELGVTGDSLDEVFQAVRQDLDEAPPARTDLSDRVRLRRAEMGMSLEAVAAATVDPTSGGRLIEADWLDRLERAALDPTEYPEYPQLDALVAVLHLDAVQVRDEAGAQFMNVHTIWSEDGQTMGLAEGELSAEDATKMRELMRLYGKAPQRRDG